VRRYNADRERREAEQREWAQRHPPRQPLAERVQRVLSSSMRDIDKMRALGFVCFGQAVGIDSQALGDWNELSDELRCRVLDACRRGLENGEPTPFPQTNIFPVSILGERAAFCQLVLSPDQAAWLTEGIIHRWLPTGLLAGLSGSWTELIR